MAKPLRHGAWTAWGGGQAGLTLVDVVVAMLILGISLVVLAAALPIASMATYQGWQQSQAAAIVEDLFEQMRTTAYTSLTSTTFPNQSSVPNYPAYSYTIAFNADTPITHTTTVTVTVTYAQSGGPATATFSTIFADPS
jgi:Tfp pilus assembly protein PilV